MLFVLFFYLFLEVTYSVYIRTGDFPASSTDADVFINIYGENGDSCKRQLMHTLLPGVFGKGKVCVFDIYFEYVVKNQ